MADFLRPSRLFEPARYAIVMIFQAFSILDSSMPVSKYTAFAIVMLVNDLKDGFEKKGPDISYRLHGDPEPVQNGFEILGIVLASDRRQLQSRLDS